MRFNEQFPLFKGIRPKGEQRNMLKSSNFTKNKRCYRNVGINLQKTFRTNILGRGTEQILLMIVGLWLAYGLWLNGWLMA